MKYLLFVSWIFLFACNNQNEATHRENGFSDIPKTPEDSLYKLVIDGHDIAMAKMGKIKGYLKQSQQVLDSIKNLPASAAKEQLQQQMMDLQEDLNYAEYSMDTWMQEFNPDSSSNDPAKRMIYLQLEEKKVNKVKDAIFNSLHRADSLFTKH